MRMTRLRIGLILALIGLGAVAFVLVGDLNSAWARRMIMFVILLNFALICFIVAIAVKIYEGQSIAHGVRSHLASITGLGEVFESHHFTPESEQAIVRAIVKEAQRGLEVLDGGERQPSDGVAITWPRLDELEEQRGAAARA